MVPMSIIGMDGPHVYNRDGWSPMCTIGMDGPHEYNRDGWSSYGLGETIDTGEEGAEKEGVGRHVHVCNRL